MNAEPASSEPMPIRMSPDEIALLTKCIKSSKFYLEFGAGGSTELAVEGHARYVVSVETDRSWIERLRTRETIQRAEAARVLYLEHVDLGPVGEWGSPASAEHIRNWPQYFMTPFTKYDLFYDFVLIDGRFRASCALSSFAFTPDHVLIAIHDYPNRPWFSDVEKFYDIVETADTLWVFKKRAKINHRSLHLAIMNNMFDYR